MKKMMITSALGLFVSAHTMAAQVSEVCADNKIVFTYTLEQGDTCDVMETVVIEGQPERVNQFTLTKSSDTTIELAPDDVALATASMRCSDDQGASATLRTSALTENGCSSDDTAAPPVTPVTPEIPVDDGEDTETPSNLEAGLAFQLYKVTKMLKGVENMKMLGVDAKYIDLRIKAIEAKSERAVNKLLKKLAGSLDENAVTAAVEEYHQNLTQVINTVK